MPCLNWDLIRKELDEQLWFEDNDVDYEDRGKLARKVYIGRTIWLYPSQKEYYPWDEAEHACETCKKHLYLSMPCTQEEPCKISGDGEQVHCDRCRDLAFMFQLRDEALERGLIHAFGQGDANYHYIMERKHKILPKK